MAIALMMMAHMVHAQVVYAKTEEFTLLKKRTLLVEQLELDEEKVEGWKRKRDKAKGSKPKVEQRYSEMIDEYTAFVNTYNAGMRAAVEAIWDFNTEVEYKTVSEIRELRKKKSTKYTVLWYRESSYNSRPTGMDEAASYPTLAIPTLN
ncbi:MAG: hypothetical protein ACFB10_25780 [Salibacteraceae bacterium]